MAQHAPAALGDFDASQEGLRVFLSYSRKDSDFTARLADGLRGRGFNADFDNAAYDPDQVSTGISAEDEWWQRLQQMIAAAEVMVFVVSPDSVDSKVCDEEIAYARSVGKRIIPVLRRAIDFSKAPPRLAALNVKIDFADDARFEAALSALAQALNRDVQWLREGTRLTQLATRWNAAGRPRDQLIHGAEISASEAWSARRPPGADSPGSIVLDFLAASRANEEEEREKEAAQIARTKRQQRWIGIATAIAIFVTIAGAVGVVIGQRGVGRAQSELMALAALRATQEGEEARALRLAALAARETWLSPASDLSRALLASSAQSSRALSERGHEGPVFDGAFSQDESRVLTWSRDNTARIWDAHTGQQIGPPLRHDGEVAGAVFSADESRVLTWSFDATARIWDAHTGQQIGPSLRHDSAVAGAVFFSNESRVLTWSFDATARIWDASTGQQIGPPLRHDDEVLGAAISQDDSRILTWGKDSTARLWDARRGQQIGTHAVAPSGVIGVSLGGGGGVDGLGQLSIGAVT